MKMGIVAATVAVAGLASSAMAGSVWINSSAVQNYTETGSVGQAKYRLSQGNFDMTIDRGQGTNTGQFIQANLGNNSQLSNVAFEFTLQHIAGEGLVFTMKNTSTNTETTLSWGTFTTTPAGTTAVLLGGEEAPGPSNPDSDRQSFNVLRLDAQANRTNNQGSGMSFSDMVFTSGLSVADGALNDGSIVTPGGGPAAPNVVQNIVSDMNLAAMDWTLTGTLSGYRDSNAGGDESVKFTIGLKQADFTIIPLPTPVTMAGAGLLMLAGVRRRYN